MIKRSSFRRLKEAFFRRSKKPSEDQFFRSSKVFIKIYQYIS
jgi:hypothetical protein